MQFQGFFDWYRFNREGLENQEEELRRTADFDFQNNFSLGRSGEAVWGLGYRITWDDLGISGDLVDPERRTDRVYSGFLQYTHEFVKDIFEVTLGTKAERNDYTAWEYQPSARFSLTPGESYTFWGAVSRAVRTPSRFDSDAQWTDARYIENDFWQGVSETQLLGDKDLDAENLTAYEVGYRQKIGSKFSFDLAGFYNQYDNVVSYVWEDTWAAGDGDAGGWPADDGAAGEWPAGDGDGQTTTVKAKNDVHGHSLGAEAVINWEPLSTWRLTTTYSYIAFRLYGDSADIHAKGVPKHQASLRSYFDATRNLTLSSAFYYYDNLRSYDYEDVDSHTRLDLGLLWRPTEKLEVSLWGQNLLEPHVLEYGRRWGVKSNVEIERGVYGKITYGF